MLVRYFFPNFSVLSTQHSALGLRMGARAGVLAAPWAVRWRRVALAAALAVALCAVVVGAGTHGGRTAVRTALFLPDMFPGAAIRPLTWITPAPRCEEVAIRYADVETVGDLCYPAGGAREGGIVLSLGVHPLERDDPLLRQVHDGLARMQLAVLRMQSPDLSNGRVVPREIDGLVSAFELLRAHPAVDPRRVGLAGFSVGGSLSLVAAADPRIRDDVALVYSFGGYYDALTVLRAITTRTVSDGTREIAWSPHPWSERVFAEQLVHTLPDDGEREFLLALLRDADLPRDEAFWVQYEPRPLQPLGELLYRLLALEQPADGDAVLRLLPERGRDTFRYLSPASHAGELRAPVYLMHDVGDSLIPYTESRALVASLPPAVHVRYDEFHMFEHVTPRDPATMLGSLADLLALWRHLYAIFLVLSE